MAIGFICPCCGTKGERPDEACTDITLLCVACEDTPAAALAAIAKWFGA